MAITPERWAVSATRPTRVYVQCLVEHLHVMTMKTQSELNIEGQQELILPHHCAATIEDLIIPLRARLQAETETEEPALRVNTEDVKRLLNVQQSNLQESATKKLFFNQYQKILELQGKLKTNGTPHARVESMLKMMEYEMNEPVDNFKTPSPTDSILMAMWLLSTAGLIIFIVHTRRLKQPYRIPAAVHEL